ncbi:hypothetical protein [Clostridium sp.]|uniref:hypothetical protein n=1 Tax=Clostridium sp. TaxID=1506 RepID=UPI003F3BFD68
MEELKFIQEEMERIHLDYCNKAKEIWTNNDGVIAEGLAKREYTRYRNKYKLLELAYSKIESGIGELNYYKEHK